MTKSEVAFKTRQARIYKGYARQAKEIVDLYGRDSKCPETLASVIEAALIKADGQGYCDCKDGYQPRNIADAGTQE